jgi:predicted transcriptional regulator
MRVTCKAEIMEFNVKKILDGLDSERRKTGLSRCKWLKLAGVCESNWYRWRAGTREPTLRNLKKLTNALAK